MKRKANAKLNGCNGMLYKSGCREIFGTTANENGRTTSVTKPFPAAMLRANCAESQATGDVSPWYFTAITNIANPNGIMSKLRKPKKTRTPDSLSSLVL